MKYINNFVNFIFESEEFTQEDYSIWKEYNRKKSRKIEPTQKEKETARKYYILRKKKLDPIAPFRKKEEKFTEEDFRNYQQYNRKKGISPTEKEIEAYNKYQRQRKKGLDPAGPFLGRKFAVITATGDWSKLTLDGSPVFSSFANTYFVTFYRNPTKEMISKASGGDDEIILFGPKDIIHPIFGGDLDGMYINKKEGLIFAVDPEYSPKDYENELVKAAKTICEDTDWNENLDGIHALRILEDWENFTPEYINHLIFLASESAKDPSLYREFTKEDRKKIDLLMKFAKYNLKGEPLKLMNPRIEIKFKVV